MSFMYIYPGSGRFLGGGFQWNSPLPGGKHEFILFLHQDLDEPQQKLAFDAATRFGFVDVRFIARGREINAEQLKQPELAGFGDNYNEAARKGASLAWYPAKPQ